MLSCAADLPAEELAHCRRLLRDGSRSFFNASYLLPQPYRGAATALYAFCREADDAIDRAHDPVAALPALEARLDAVYAGEISGDLVDRAFQQVVEVYALPRELFDALLEGFAWDASGRRYASLSEVIAYGARVAGTVGAMMAMLMGTRHPRLIARAADLGVAMQLTNIARDVGEDARNGRLYLPADWLREVGISPQGFLGAPAPSAALAEVVDRLLAVADDLYARADAGIAGLPRRCRPAIRTARLLYAEIGREVQRNQSDSVSQRAVVAPRRKLHLAAHAFSGFIFHDPGHLELPPLEETAFLVDAVTTAPAPTIPPTEWRTLHAVLNAFEDLERRDREQQVAFTGSHRGTPATGW